MGGTYKSVSVQAAKRISREFDKDIVVVLAFDTSHMKMHTTTYGKTPEDKQAAALLGDRLTEACGVDITKRETFSDFRDPVIDSPIHIDDGGVVATLHLRLPPLTKKNNVVVDDVWMALSGLDFLEPIDFSRDVYSVHVKARSVAEMHRLLPAYKARIREALVER